ncbi:hypothetical protein TNIN_322661 [Trichonephila inaurata madagascariensis]|uniref:Uncharacterized protein n=1 Tax=Trichonephila inaurata madagascariensis TaxID=2747483 RepID=A0A8X6Y852_9ARAC|nr:hypothetical protein TNIN_322661 [Trichonephila inaurata madagascariensis]
MPHAELAEGGHDFFTLSRNRILMTHWHFTSFDARSIISVQFAVWFPILRSADVTAELVTVVKIILRNVQNDMMQISKFVAGFKF